jgi:phage recombination protein Bet
MAQAARERQAVTIAPRYTKPGNFAGTDAAWRSLCECYPNAETPDVVMAVVEYCAVRHLDPYRRPVHVVPMYNSRLRRKVQVVMQGINEVEITAARTQQWAGMDAPEYGPTVSKTFRGSFENDDGSTRNVEATVEFPEWCKLTVYRLIGGQPRSFTEQLWWIESYGRAGFRSEVPNERWTKAPRQMLHKCTKAAVLRAAFPEEASDYTAEEMEDHETDAGGVTIDGKVDHGDPALTDRDRQADRVYQPQPPPDATAGLALLEEQNGTRWIKNLQTLLEGAASETAVVEIAGHQRVRQALDKAPPLIVQNINDWLRMAHQRFAEPPDDVPPVTDETIWDDPIAELIAEVDAMDLDGLDLLPGSASWKVKTRNLFPPDEDRLNEAIALRRATLKGSKT